METIHKEGQKLLGVVLLGAAEGWGKLTDHFLRGRQNDKLWSQAHST